MHQLMMYYLNDQGERVYTLKKKSPSGKLCIPAHPARIVLCFHKTLGQDLPKVLQPIREVGDEVAILLVPGAYINALMYEPLGLALQNATSLRLWVGLVGPFATDLPNPEQCSRDIDNTLTMMRDLGMQTDILFLAGHSLGGVVMQTWGWANTDQLSGMILMASELNLDSLANCTRPVMHISGDLDGLETVAEQVPVYVDLSNLVPLEPSKLSFPLTILEDVNHMHFASGDIPLAVSASDILSPMSEDEAHTLIALHMLAFMTSTIMLPSEDVDDAQNLLLGDYDTIGVIMQPIFEMNRLTDGGSFSEWSQIGQVIMSSIIPSQAYLLNVTDTMLSFSELELSRPLITQDGFDVYIETYTNVSYPGILEVAGPVSAKEMAVKFKSREAVMEVMYPLGASFNGNTTCELVNSEALLVTLGAATDLQVSRYESRGKKIIFTDDDEKVTGQAWVSTDIVYTTNSTNLLVTSISLHTSTDVGFELGGMHYCKLMPPARMIEYLMIDSLRDTQP